MTTVRPTIVFINLAKGEIIVFITNSKNTTLLKNLFVNAFRPHTVIVLVVKIMFHFCYTNS